MARYSMNDKPSAISHDSVGVHSRQKCPVRPTLAKIACASSLVGRRKSGSNRLPYHRCDKSHACASVMIAPRTTPRARHQRPTSSSDRKSRMFAHVKKMSSQKCAAGTSRWMTPVPYARPSSTPHGIGSADQAQRASIRASEPSAAGMPNASHAQGAYHDDPACVRNAVGTAENGGADQMSRAPACRTITCERASA